MDIYEDPEYARELLDFITEATITRIKAWRQFMGQPERTPSWGFTDDSIALLSVKTYEELVLPIHRRLVETFSEGGPNGIHLCGDATRHFPTLQRELNIQAFDTGFPVDFAWLRKTLGPDVEIHGGPHVAILHRGTAEEIRHAERAVLESGIMEGGRFHLTEGNNLPPRTPVENLEAAYNAAREFGVYRPL